MSKALGGFPPTEEQVLIRDHYMSGENIMVDAGAGSSKTSSSIYLSEQDNRSSLYLAFNKAIATEAMSRFPPNVTIKTFHGLAYGFVGYKYKNKLFRPKGGYVNVAMTISEISKFFNVKPIRGCNSLRVSSLAKDIVTRYEYSADVEMGHQHIPERKLIEYKRYDDTVNIHQLKGHALAYAQMIWNERVDLKSPVLCSHDTYLKLFQLSSPVLHYDCIIGDEFQDVNPVVADIVLNQKAQRILIGDPNQSIYGWRGAQNFLTDNDEFTTLYLSKSFRYGQEIADLAMKVLNFKRVLTGFEKKSTKIGSLDTNQPYTKIFRTNGALIIEAVGLILEGISVLIDINPAEFISKINNVVSLKNGEKWKVKHKDIIIFEEYRELEAEAEYDPELKRIINLINKDQVEELVNALSNYRKPKNPHVIFTTGHKAKGLEWDNVMMADDFPVPIDEEGAYYELSQGEINLLYVVLTRATKNLEINLSVKTILAERDKVKRVGIVEHDDEGLPIIGEFAEDDKSPFVQNILEDAKKNNPNIREIHLVANLKDNEQKIENLNINERCDE